MTNATLGHREQEVRVLALEQSGYIGAVLERLSAAGVRVGDRIRVVRGSGEFTGILMPRAQIGADPDHVVVKLDSGYNIGIRVDSNTTVKRLKSPKRVKQSREAVLTPKESLPTVAVLSTGGTIASRVDYQTGAVNPALSAQDLYEAVPELQSHANIRARVVMSKFSEDITPADWATIAKRTAREIRNGADGVVIAHGTDTLALTAAALSFSLQNLPVPVVLVGSQRSSDRPSSDAALNLVAAVDVAGRADAAEVLLVMHGETDDTFTLAHRGTRARKCHTSRRDAFQSINASPVFRVESSEITEMSPPLYRRDPTRRLRVKAKFDDHVALIKMYPGLKPDVIEYLISAGYRGIVLEGTGLGHTPQSIHLAVKQAIDAGVVVAMTSQCIWGRVDMNVYRSGVKLLDIGVVPCQDMLPETALVKLMWLLANTKHIEAARRAMAMPLVGEISYRTELVVSGTGGSE
ncbi:MAG: Glu-tRNA(Gln) amidotransferase GatDE subunit D [Candidatus Thorarchaeota archaeon]|nr:MAG: Glu-tRNA(Gln) amidotransferase GatDE subunit D [Candidatus Thorarchaeota archaeon]